MKHDIHIQTSRLREVAKKVFGGSVRMGNELGMAQPNWSKYMTGSRRIGPKVRSKLVQQGLNPAYVEGQSDDMFANNDAGHTLAQRLFATTTKQQSSPTPEDMLSTPTVPYRIPDKSQSLYQLDGKAILADFPLQSQRIRLFCMTTDILPPSLELLPMMEVSLQLGIPVDPLSTIAIRIVGSSLEANRIFNNDIVIVDQRSNTGNSLLYSLNSLPVVYTAATCAPAEAVFIGTIRIVLSYR